MRSKYFLHSLKNEQELKSNSSNIYFSEYYRNPSFDINRDGIFFSIFNKLFDPEFKNIPHIALARFEAFNDQAKFYCLKTNNNFQMNENSTLLLFFNLNLLDSPLELINDFLLWLINEFLIKFPKIKIRAHYNYNLDISGASEQIYVSSYFQLIQKHLVHIPDALTVVDLEKKSSFDNWLAIEAGSQWSCLDNYLVHLVLSKGCGRFEADNLDLNFEVISTTALSPCHYLQIVKKDHYKNVLSRCSFLEDVSQKNYIKYPQDMKLFYYLIYKNIFK
ncbi:MAG: hypothetical protein PHY93_06025 [Bacteriovorax sp.]|nr:hypothetical protein [Bacteriovorax sp.]